MSGRLSSDILEQQFGPTVVQVLDQAEQTRLICTQVVATNQVLEVSFVTFIEAGVQEFSAVHRLVLAGESMGKAFRTAGVLFTRQTTAISHQELSPLFSQQFESEGSATIVEVVILVGPEQVPYAKIIETYSPAVRWPT